MVNGSFPACVQLQYAIQNLPFSPGHPAMQEQMFAPCRHHGLDPEHGTVRQTFIQANTGCAVAQINEAKLAHQIQEPDPVCLIDSDFSNHGDGTIVKGGSLGELRNTWRQCGFSVKRMDEVD